MSTPIKIKELKFNKTEYSKIKKSLRDKLELYNIKQCKNYFNQQLNLFISNDYPQSKKKFCLTPKNKYIYKNIISRKIDNHPVTFHKSNTSKNVCKSRNILKNNNINKNNKTIFSSQNDSSSNNAQYTISIINTDELSKKMNDIPNYINIPEKKFPTISKKFNWNQQKKKSKSLLYNLYKNSKVDNYKIENRYEPKIKDFINEKYYYKLGEKKTDFSNCKKEIKFSFRNTKLMIAIFDYLNKSISRYRLHCSVEADKTKLEEIERKKKDKIILDKKLKNDICLPVNDFLKINKILIAKNNVSLSPKSSKCFVADYKSK